MTDIDNTGINTCTEEVFFSKNEEKEFNFITVSIHIGGTPGDSEVFAFTDIELAKAKFNELVELNIGFLPENECDTTTMQDSEKQIFIESLPKDNIDELRFLFYLSAYFDIDSSHWGVIELEKHNI